MKLYSKNVHDAGQEIHLPVVGVVTFDEEGVIEIENEDDAYQLLELCPGRLSADKKQAEKMASPETSTPEGRLASLKKLRMSDLKEMAKEFPEEEWKNLKKDNGVGDSLVEYLAEKLNAADAAAAADEKTEE